MSLRPNDEIFYFRGEDSRKTLIGTEDEWQRDEGSRRAQEIAKDKQEPGVEASFSRRWSTREDEVRNVD